jgi:kanosamine 6-kinase
MSGYLGVDVGGTKVAFLLERDGRALDGTELRWPQPGTADDDLALLTDALRAVRQEWGEPLTAVGVAMPATLDRAGRVTAWPSRPGWADRDLSALFGGVFPGTVVSFADDGDLAAVAEADAADCADLVYLGVGTGIGGGVVSGRKPWPGPARGSCELGHLVVDRAGPRCACGRRGCLQALASGPATLRRAGRLCGREVTFAEFRQAYAARASWATEAAGESCAALAAALTGVCEFARPELVSIGGGFAAALPGFAAEVAARTAALARPGHPPVPVRAALLDGRSSLLGAVRLARNPEWAAVQATRSSRARAASR